MQKGKFSAAADWSTGQGGARRAERGQGTQVWRPESAFVRSRHGVPPAGVLWWTRPRVREQSAHRRLSPKRIVACGSGGVEGRCGRRRTDAWACDRAAPPPAPRPGLAHAACPSSRVASPVALTCSVKRLKSEDLPTLGRPTRPIRRLLRTRPKRPAPRTWVSSLAPFFLGGMAAATAAAAAAAAARRSAGRPVGRSVGRSIGRSVGRSAGGAPRVNGMARYNCGTLGVSGSGSPGSRKCGATGTISRQEEKF